MKFLIDIGHPAHVHLFKNFIKQMSSKGHEFLVTAREKEITFRLLEAYDIDYVPVGKIKSGILNLIIEWLKRDIQVYRLAKKFKPDYILGTLNPTVGHVSKLLGVPSIIFTDYEPSSIRFPLAYYFTVPFVDRILVPDAVRHDYGKKSVKIPTFKELAYLHPKNFTPDHHLLEKVGLLEDEKYAILRFVSWGAHHDLSNRGFSDEEKWSLVSQLGKYCKVFISSESSLPSKFEPFRLPIKPHEMHSFLFYSSLLVCDSQTMATEAALLGVPVIRFNDFVGESDMGNFHTLERKYGLLYNLLDFQDVLETSSELISDNRVKVKWDKKRRELLKEHVDLTEYLVNLSNSIIR